MYNWALASKGTILEEIKWSCQQLEGTTTETNNFVFYISLSTEQTYQACSRCAMVHVVNFAIVSINKTRLGIGSTLERYFRIWNNR